jgi:tRNA/tmRNA/rRNA uracil-C5-methylase (TrmA/RlmC/RlmD family)
VGRPACLPFLIADARGASTVVIERLGSKGDGQVRIDGDWVSVPHRYCLAKKSASLSTKDKVKLLEIVTPSPDRQVPACPHFSKLWQLQPAAPGRWALSGLQAARL